MNVSEFSRQFTPRSSNLALMSTSAAGEAVPSGVKGDGTDPEFNRIEELIRENTFTREEINSLLEILNSRAEELERNTASRVDGVGQQDIQTHEITRTPAVDKLKDLDRLVAGTSREQRDVPVGVDASPIDIARAFMAARNTDQSQDPSSSILKGERSLMTNDFARNPHMQSPPVKSSTCWPGAMVQDHCGYTTPQSQRGRYGIPDFPRTPYSRTSLSKSTTRLRADSRFPSTSTPFQPSQTSIFGQARVSESVGGGSVGPVRRIRNKYATEVRPRGSIFQNSLKDSSSKMGKLNEGRGFLPGAETNMEPGETSGSSKKWSTGNVFGSSDRGSQNQHVKKILEHLDRKKPTPREKEEELKLATSWRNTSATGANNAGLLHIGEKSASKSTGIGGVKFPAELPKSSSFFNSQGKFHGQVMGADDRSNNIVGKASGSFGADSSRIPGSNALSTFGPKENSDPVNILDENLFGAINNGRKESRSIFATHVSNGTDARPVAGPSGADPSNNHGTKPSLTSIFVSRPHPRPVSSDNGPTFSFPVSASAGVLSEPPTPSMIPSSTTISLPQPQDIPSYSFGGKKSGQPLVFSFPSTSNASTSEEASDLKFTFGSDEKTRLSFSSFGNDTVCY